MAQENLKPHSHLPYGEDGSGFYSDNNDGCYDVILATQPIFHEAIQYILKELKNPPTLFTIADFGTADGGVSMPLFYSAVKLIKKLCGEEQAVHIVYEDQATNDFKSVFMRINGFIPGPRSFLTDFPNTFISAVGVSFFTPCIPPESYHLGFAATCFHWLSKKPCNIKNGLHHTQITDPDVKDLFSKQAAKDWEEILLQRAKEMRKGGRFIMAQFCIDENGHHVGNTVNIKNPMHKVMNNLMKEMVSLGQITQEEYDNTTISNYYRTLEEYKAPFQEETAVTKAGLHLVSISTKLTRCPYHEKWLKEGGDSEQYARAFIPNTRVWSNHTFYAGLSESRSEEERRAIVDEFFGKFEKLIAESPADHGMDYVHAHIVLEKK